MLHKRLQGGTKSAQAELILVGTSDGKLQLLNASSGKLDKQVDAHEGATLCVRWSHDGTGFLTSECTFSGGFIVLGGEDGALKTWSRNGLLRNILTQAGRPIYAADWSADGSRVVYTFGEHCVITSLKAQVRCRP